MPPEHDILWVSYHLSKTAGTSLRDDLSKMFKGRFWLSYKKRKKPAAKQSLGEGERTVQCVHGHLVFTRHIHLVNNRHCKFLVFLRDPLDRAVSLYNYEKLFGAHKSKTLEQYLFGEFKKHSISAYENRVYHQTNKRFSDFDFIGFSEKYRDSVIMFSRMAGKQFKGVSKLNTGPRSTRVTGTQRRKFMSVYAADYCIYNSCKKKMSHKGL